MARRGRDHRTAGAHRVRRGGHESERHAREGSAGPHYQLGKVKIIVDEALKDVGQFEKAAFQAELAQFAKEVKTTQLKSNDIVMIYLAGLGEVVGKEFYFVPPIGEIKNLAQLAVVQRYSIPWAAFRNLIEDIPNCGKVFFLDTCYAGSIARLESEKARLRPLKNLNTVVSQLLAELRHAVLTCIFTFCSCYIKVITL